MPLCGERSAGWGRCAWRGLNSIPVLRNVQLPLKRWYWKWQANKPGSLGNASCKPSYCTLIWRWWSSDWPMWEDESYLVLAHPAAPLVASSYARSKLQPACVPPEHAAACAVSSRWAIKISVRLPCRIPFLVAESYGLIAPCLSQDTDCGILPSWFRLDHQLCSLRPRLAPTTQGWRSTLSPLNTE